MRTFKTPGVFIEKVSVLPPSVAEVETAIPAFIGYTEKAVGGSGINLINKPTRITSKTEYEAYFGGPHAEQISINVDDDTNGGFTAKVDQTNLNYLLCYCIRQFFDNGGGPCYIVSVGSYAEAVSDTALISGLDQVRKLDEPTLIVIPEAVKISRAPGYANVVQSVLKQCGDLGDRFGIFDVYGGENRLDKAGWEGSRELFANSNLSYGAAYYPFLRTALKLHVAVNDEGIFGENVKVRYPASSARMAAVELTNLLKENPALYNFVRSILDTIYVTLPASAAVAGVYAATDDARGVWKAPANVSLNGVIEPAVKIDSEEQAGMNVDIVSGKSINAIRLFPGKGTMIWGARTLAGNDNEWRYIPVRRFFNMVEESVKESSKWVVFEPNDASTWVKVQAMIENYLTQKWRDGALAGATPEEAFFVKCGLGSTMTSQDLSDGRLIILIGMAVVRPAEFIILKISHKLASP